MPTTTRDGIQARQGVFISYARADGEAAARRIHARLQADAPDVPAWLDRFEVEGGVGWWMQIEQELDRAEFLILIMTPSASGIPEAIVMKRRRRNTKCMTRLVC